MANRRAIREDVSNKKLNNSLPYSRIGANGKLKILSHKKDENLQNALKLDNKDNLPVIEKEVKQEVVIDDKINQETIENNLDLKQDNDVNLEKEVKVKKKVKKKKSTSV